MQLFDFSDPMAVQAWRAIDDRVMGGVSHSRLRHDLAGHAVFEGVVSLEQHGGFASVRSSPGACGAAQASACLLEVRGDGKSYQLSLFLDDGLDSIAHQAGFRPEGPTWHPLRLPLASFRARLRGRDVVGAPPLEAARIRQVGLGIAARQAGPFALDIRRIGLA